MPRLFAAAVVFAAVVPVTASEPRKPPSPLAAVLSAKYTRATKVADIPRPILAALQHLMKYDPRLADPGEPFNATDVSDDHSPWRRLILAGGNDTSWFVFYEHGGRGYLRQLVLFAVDGDKATCKCAWAADGKVSSFQDLEAASKRGLVGCGSCDASGYF